MTRAFDPKTDIPKLRGCLQDLAAHYGVNPPRLIEAVLKYRQKHAKDGGSHLMAREVISRTSLQNFLGKANKIPKDIERLRDIWNCLAEHPHYSKALADAIGPEEELAAPLPETGKRAAEAVLSEALTGFLHREKPATLTQMQALRERYPGKYVMYRADLRPYKLKVDTPPRFRASYLDIALVENELVVTEVQDFPKTKTDDSFYMKTTGILFPYGKHILFLAQAIVRESFRLGVIDREFSFTNDYKVSFFQGMILVASSEDLFPSTPFFCLRDDGTLETGLIPLERIAHIEAQAHLRQAHEKAAFLYK